MKKRAFQIGRIAALLVGSLVLAAGTLQAAQPPITLPVSVELAEGSALTEEDITVRMVSDESGQPMPEGTEDAQCEVTVFGGSGSAAFPQISYTAPGVYHYTISQLPGAVSGAAYDDTVYHMSVTVIQTEAGPEAMVALHIDGQEEKPDAIRFTNRYLQAAISGSVEDTSSEESPSEETPKQEESEKENRDTGEDTGEDKKEDNKETKKEDKKQDSGSEAGSTARRKEAPSGAVRTGDDTPVGIYLFLLLSALAGLAAASRALLKKYC